MNSGWLHRVVTGVGVLVLATTTGCSGPRPTLETNSIAFTFTVPKKFQARIDPHVKFDPEKGLRLVFDYSSFPEGASLGWLGKEHPLTRNGTVDDGFDVSEAAGAMPANAASFAPAGPLRVSFAKGKHVFDLTVMPIVASIAIDECLRSVPQKPCIFKGDAPAAAAVPRIAYFPVGAILSSTKIGAPATFRDIDWVAIGAPLDVETSQKCTMVRRDNPNAKHSFDLKIAREEVSLYDRRTGAKLQTKILTAKNECPFGATIADTASSVTNPLEEADRQRFFRQFRGEAPPPVAEPPVTTPPPKAKKKK